MTATAGDGEPTPIRPSTTIEGDTREGFVIALLTYCLWGALPFYMKAVAHVPAVEVVAHRILWSLPIAGAVLLWLGRTADLKRAFGSMRTMAQATLVAAVISFNWLVYVWAIAAERTVEAALGYYINPLFSVLLAAVVLREKLSPLQWTAVGLAAAAVAFLTWEAGSLPWVSLSLTFSWGIYALLKRALPIGPNQGFFLEVAILSPFALAYLVWLGARGEGHFLDSGYNIFILMMAGVVTAVPLMMYANAAKKLRLSTIGIMQYIAPTLIFLTAILAFGEPFGWHRLVAFAMIWMALALYSVSLLAAHRSTSRA